MSVARMLMMGVCVVALAGCTGFKSKKEVESLNAMQSVGSPFTRQMTTEYRDMANTEQNDELDYPDALHFARKGLATGRGDLVMPEPVSDWNLNATDLAELVQGRARLVAALDKGAREVAPREAAIAQARFDCWIEEQEESWGKGVPCKAAFNDALGALEGIMGAYVPPEVPPPVTDLGITPTEPMAKEDAVYLVFFDFDSTDLNEGALNVIDTVVPEIQKQSASAPVRLLVVGHADTSGSEEYNMRLSAQRAEAVQAALAQRGVDISSIAIEQRGESDLMVATPDGVREPANRRAVITFQ